MLISLMAELLVCTDLNKEYQLNFGEKITKTSKQTNHNESVEKEEEMQE